MGSKWDNGGVKKLNGYVTGELLIMSISSQTLFDDNETFYQGILKFDTTFGPLIKSPYLVLNFCPGSEFYIVNKQ